MRQKVLSCPALGAAAAAPVCGPDSPASAGLWWPLCTRSPKASRSLLCGFTPCVTSAYRRLGGTTSLHLEQSVLSPANIHFKSTLCGASPRAPVPFSHVSEGLGRGWVLGWEQGAGLAVQGAPWP